jgi:hypothetical protein
VAEGEEVLDGTFRAGPVVDVDAGRREARQRSLQHDRKALAHDLPEVAVVDARAGHDDAVGATRSEQVSVRPVARLERLDDHSEPARSSRARETPQRLGQQCVAGNLLRRLAQDKPHCLAPAAGQLSRRGVRMVAQLAGCIEHPLARGRADARGAVVQHERHGRSRNAGTSRHVSARGSPGIHRAEAPRGRRKFVRSGT